MELRAEVAEQIGDAALHGRVDVLVGGIERERSREDRVADPFERLRQTPHVVVRQPAGVAQRADVSDPRLHVFRDELCVDLERAAQRLRLRSGYPGEPAAPQLAGPLRHGFERCFADQTLSGSPYSVT